ncbi:MAG: toprim domain-containing protein [Solirubrobacteraceae bacterium]
MSARGFYDALGIELPDGRRANTTVHCFIEPAAHLNGDRAPSCSVGLITGAFLCHGCGARGGAYDAALAAGRTPRAAMDLLRAHGLIEAAGEQPSGATATRPDHRPRSAAMRPALAADDDEVNAWAENLEADGRLIRRLILERAWAPSAVRRLGIGYDGARITIPIRNASGRLRGVLRYDPFGPRRPKMLAAPGTRLGLIPHPEVEPSERVILTEGPPDMIAARSAGLAAIAVPGTEAWQPHWAHLLAGRRVTIVMDCDRAGRRAAEAITQSLAGLAAAVQAIDLSPDRHDGYDLTDRIFARRRRHAAAASSLRTSTDLLRPQLNSRAGQEASR